MTALHKKENRIRAFRQTKGWSLQTLADAVGTSKSQIDKLEKGERRLTVEWLVRLAKHLDCDPRDLLPPALLPKAKPSQDDLFQLRALRRDNGKYYRAPAMMEPPVKRPPFLEDSVHAYAMTTFGDALYPAYKENGVMFIDPDRIPDETADVLVSFTDNSAIIGEYVKQTATTLALHHTRPTDETTTYPLDSIESIHVIAGYYAR